MKVKLLNDGRYGYLDDVEFPVVVNATKHAYLDGWNVHYSELRKAGAMDSVWEDDDVVYFYGCEVEVVE